MAERKAQPAAKKTAVTKAAGKAAVKPQTARIVATAAPKKAAAKKTVAAAKPKAAKPPAAKKTVAPAAVKKAPTQKSASAKARPIARKVVAQPTPEERYRMVQTAAYFIAERDGFCGCPTEYWVAAEIEIANRLG